MNSTSIRFKMSVLIESVDALTSSVIRITESAISRPPQAGGDPELFLQREHTMPQAASKLAVARSTTPASISKTPVAEHKSTITTVTVPDNGGPKKIAAEAILVDKCFQPTEFRSWRISFTSEVFHSSQSPEPRCDGLAKLRMLIVLTISLPQHPSQEDQFRISRILISRLRADSGKSQQETSKTSHHSQKREHLQADRLDDPRILQQIVATTKSSWTSVIY